MLKKLGLFLIAFILIFTFIISSVYLLTPMLNKHKPEIEQWLSSLLQQSIKINTVQIGWHYFKPIITLHNIIIPAEKNQPFTTHLNYLMIDINFWQLLFHWQLTPKKVVLEGTRLKIIQEPNGAIILVGIGNQTIPQKIQLSNFLNLLRTMQLQLKNVQIEWQTKNKPIQTIQIDTVTVKNAQDYYYLVGEFQIANQAFSKIKINTKFLWKPSEDGKWYVQIPLFNVKTTGFFAEGKGQILLIPNHKTNLFLELHSSIKDVNLLKQILSLKKIRKNLRNWLMTALVYGEDLNSKIIFKGNIEDFPFKADEGIFIANTTVRNLTLDYKPGWPVLKHVSGEVTFHNLSMRVKANMGAVGGAVITALNATIPDIINNPKLILNGSLKGTLDQLVNFLQTSPLQQKIGERIHRLRATGPMQLKLRLQIPLQHDKNLTTMASGNIHTDNGQLNLKGWQISLHKIRGILNFNNYVLSANDLKAQFLDQPASMEVNTFETNNHARYYSISLSSQVSLNTLKNQFNLPKIPYLDGGFSYQTTLNLYANQTEQDKLIITSDLRDLNIDLPKPFGKDKMQIVPLRLEIPLLQNSLQIILKYSNNISALLSYQKTQNNLKLKINSPPIAGDITFLKNKKIIARLRHLYLTDLLEKPTLEGIHPNHLPDLNLEIDDFRFGENIAGAIRLSTEKIENGMQINHFSYTNGHIRLNAQGDWMIDNNKNSSHLYGLLHASQFAELLNSFQITPFMHAKNADINFNLRWEDTPFRFDPLRSLGSFSMQTGNGSFPRMSNRAEGVDFGRMLTLLSLQSLPRRLTLNFNDLTLQGFSFDSMHGNLALKQGELSTHDMRLQGIVADVKLQGSINLLQKQVYLLVNITPHLTSSLPVIATIAAGPVVGIATFFANTLLSPTLDDMAARHYQILGDWTNPLIKEAHV